MREGNKALFSKIGIDLDNLEPVEKSYFQGLVREYKKVVGKFNDKTTIEYFNQMIAAFMLEFHKEYENFDIKIPYRIKSAKSVFIKLMEYLSRDDKSNHTVNENNEEQVGLKEDLKDMFAATVVACSGAPTLFSDDPKINELIDEKKRNLDILEEMQRYRIKVTSSEFAGGNRESYKFDSSREEYYLNCLILLDKIKSLIDPRATKLLQRYTDMEDRIRFKVPNEFYMVAESVTYGARDTEKVSCENRLVIVSELMNKYIDRKPGNMAELVSMKLPITQEDVDDVDILDLIDDFTARINDKLDLAVLTAQVQNVIGKSELLKKFGVSIVSDSLREKRTASGYVSNFLYLNTPLGQIEMQLQSQHENKEGSYGYAAHSDMDGKGMPEFEIPHRGDREAINVFRRLVEFVSAKKFLAQYDTGEQNRVLTQVFGKYQNYKSIMTQVQDGSEEKSRLDRYFATLYKRKNELFPGEARQESIESFIRYDINKYLKSIEFRRIKEGKEEHER